MKVLHVNANYISGGAAKVAYHLNDALREVGIDSNLYIQKEYSPREFVFGPNRNLLYKIANFSRQRMGSLEQRKQATEDKNLYESLLPPPCKS